MSETASPEQVCRFLVTHLGLRRHGAFAADAEGARGLLRKLRCIQLDPLDRIGRSPELVAMARIPGLKRGQLFDLVYPGGAFEHFAKERCLLPPSAFPHYRDQAVETPWWRATGRLKRVDPADIEHVERAVTAGGPLSSADLEDLGKVDPIDWHGWKGTSKRATMALRVLWTQCRVVTCGRSGNQRHFDVPERALPDHAELEPPEDFDRWAIRERVEAAGIIAQAGGPWWSMLDRARKAGLVDALVDAGELERFTLPGSRRAYLAAAGWRERYGTADHESDGKMRIIAPLDPLIWNRTLVRQAFGFEYLWEVYKPAADRRWGYYVCPLLQGDRLVGRFEGIVREGKLVVVNLWREATPFDDAAYRAALVAHAERLDVEPPDFDSIPTRSA